MSVFASKHFAVPLYKMESMKSKAGVDEQRDTNFLNDGRGSAQQKYYEFMLRTEKLKSIATTNGAFDSSKVPWMDKDEYNALNSISDKEKIELKVLGRLYQLPDTDANYLQVKTITGSDSREEIAAKLADVYFKKYVTDDILAKFVDPKKTREQVLEPAATSARKAIRTAFGATQNAE